MADKVLMIGDSSYAIDNKALQFDAYDPPPDPEPPSYDPDVLYVTGDALTADSISPNGTYNRDPENTDRFIGPTLGDPEFTFYLVKNIPAGGSSYIHRLQGSNGRWTRYTGVDNYDDYEGDYDYINEYGATGTPNATHTPPAE